ncbi:unnamed protein product [Angiostrongylus costaricensis]|uniref:G_PROTEIN_RECEP_F1_2 domain-containing protein n=1 Tax=Angiostrongylus costaricensis TaxID=334426 RepID=A0A158PKI1_ANGCS|nr:unnamed protein product [Angiostrongylus costaricensis]
MAAVINVVVTGTHRNPLFQFLAPFTSVFSQIHSYLYVFLCVIGVFANVAIVVVLLRYVEMCHPWFFTHAWMIYTRFYAMFSVFVHSASLWITVNMAVMSQTLRCEEQSFFEKTIEFPTNADPKNLCTSRYLVLFRGSHPHSRLPPCNGYPAACIAIVIGVVIAFIGSLPNMFRYRVWVEGLDNKTFSCYFLIEFVVEMEVPKICFQTKYKSSWFATDTIYKYDLSQPSWWNCHWERVNFWMAACVLKLVPCVLLTVFMTLLVRMLIEARERRLRLSGGVATGNSQAERTTAMLTGIVAVFLITELPQGILGLAVGVNPRLMFIINPLGNFFDLLSLINSAVNFVLCALMSHVFRREFLRTFRMCCPQSSENHSGAPITKSSDKKVLNCSV